jgi:hypothetical protein
MVRLLLLIGWSLTGLLGARTALAQCVDGEGASCVAARFDYAGSVDFFATGGTFTFNDDEDDRPDGLLDVGRVDVNAGQIPARARLVQAFLYFGGSLYADGDGVDEPDQTVELLAPGRTEAQTVQADDVFVSGPIDGFPELTLYTARADITALLSDTLAGTYEIRGFDADIDDDGVEHTAANASFSLVLVFEEPRLPPRNVVLFDGLQTVLGSTVTLDLSGFLVSPLPSGALTLYALEGDCHPGPDACAVGNNLSGTEGVVVRARGGRSLRLSDPANPENDIFNRTINTTDPVQRDVVGTDIDTFDISSVLEPGDDAITVELTAPRPRGGNRGELVGLAYVVVGIDVFAPELEVDSRIEVRSDTGDGALFPGDILDVVVAVSNTGNLPADQVRVETELPSLITGFEVLTATGAEVEDRRIVAEGLSVRDGEVEGLTLRVQTRCPLPEGDVLALTATISGAGVPPFVVTSTQAIEPRTECGPRFEIFGGGGCRSGGGSVWGLALAAGWLGWVARRRRSRVRVRIRTGERPGGWRRSGSGPAGMVLLAGLAVPHAGCGDDGSADRAAPSELGFDCPGQPGMAVVPSVNGAPPFCIDRYEASFGPQEGALGNPVQPMGGDGSTTVVARSERFSVPARGLTWFQAAAACANAGKSLCSGARWRAACGGADDLTYPYGDGYEAGRCNGFRAGRGDVVPTGGFIDGRITDEGENVADGCVGPFGVYDQSGNLAEWTSDRSLGGARRGLLGGSFRSNASGLTCLTENEDAAPETTDEAFGFRCCVELDLPQ